MVGNLIVWLILLIVTGLLIWLTIRTWRARNKVLKFLGGIFVTLFSVILLLASVLSGIGLYRMYVPHADPAPSLTVEGTQEQIARGEHIAGVYCIDCHTTNGQLPLVGGRDMGADSPVPIGSFVSFNLTPGGPLAGWTDGEIFRTLRQGVDKDGRPVMVMSSASTRFLSDEDIKAVIAFLRSQPAVTAQVQGGDNPTLILAMFEGSGLLPIPPQIQGTIQAPAKDTSVEYGKYVVTFMGCGDCHGAELAGGKQGGFTPVGPSLRVVKGWTQDQFLSTLRNGVDPTGHALSDQMPWKNIRKLDDVELGAVYQYLNSLGSVASQ